MTLQRMDNVGIVVESLDAAISFFVELGLELEGRTMIEGDWSGRVTGLRDQRVEIAMMRTPDGHGRIELSRFLAPPVVADHRNARSTLWATCVSCSPWTTSTIRWPGSADTARSSSMKWSSTKTCIGSATSEAPRAFSSGWPSKSADAQTRSGVIRERWPRRANSNQAIRISRSARKRKRRRQSLLLLGPLAEG